MHRIKICIMEKQTIKQYQKHKLERCGFKFFPLCLAFPLFPLFEIDVTNLPPEIIKKFKNRNYEYTLPFITYLNSKYWKYFSCGWVTLVIISIICLPWTLPTILEDIIMEFSKSPQSMILSIMLISFVYIVSFLWTFSFLVWVIYFKDNIKISHEGVYYKDFFSERLIQWEDIEDVRQTYPDICIILLKDKNIFKKYLYFFTVNKLFIAPFIINRKISEVCKFVKFKLMEKQNRRVSNKSTNGGGIGSRNGVAS